MDDITNKNANKPNTWQTSLVN